MRSGSVLGRAFLLLVVLVIVSAGVSAAQGYTVVHPEVLVFARGENASLTFRVFNESGSPVNTSSSCAFSLYNASSVVFEGVLSFVSPYDYVVNVSGAYLDVTGEKSFIAYCENVSAGVGGYVAGSLEVTPSGLAFNSGEDLTPIAVAILLPFLIAVLTIIGSVTMDSEEHPALKIGLFLFSYLPFYMSVWFAGVALNRWYDFPELSEAFADSTFYYTLFFVLLVFYVVAYFTYKAFAAIAEKKAKRLQY